MVPQIAYFLPLTLCSVLRHKSLASQSFPSLPSDGPYCIDSLLLLSCSTPSGALSHVLMVASVFSFPDPLWFNLKLIIISTSFSNRDPRTRCERVSDKDLRSNQLKLSMPHTACCMKFTKFTCIRKFFFYHSGCGADLDMFVCLHVLSTYVWLLPCSTFKSTQLNLIVAFGSVQDECLV